MLSWLNKVPKNVVVNHNLCAACLKASSDAPLPSWTVSDTGECGRCKRDGNVFDLALVALYRGMGFSDSFVSRHLPRLRCPHTGPGSQVWSWEDIGRRLTHVVASEFNQG